MEDESITFIHSSKQLSSSMDSISILVVDDDTTCLTIVAAILKKFKYQVVTVNHPNDALSTLRSKCFSFDLVVADVHMPDMNGFQLQQTIAQEFNNLPVILMSADDKENTAIKGIETGAAFFILKPVMPDDLKDLWQFAAMRKRTGRAAAADLPPAEDQHKRKSDTSSDDEAMQANSDTYVNGDYPDSKKDVYKGKSPRKGTSSEDKNGENSNSSNSNSQSESPQKKPKVIWTNSLHNRFLEAIRSIGLDRAVPKKILEVMNVPGLTRENVASHLQKYRIFLRRVSDASHKIQYTTDKGASRSIRPSFDFSKLTPQSTRLLDRLSNTPRFPNPGHLQFQGPALPSPHEDSSSSLVSPSSGFGQSRLLGNNKRKWLGPSIGNTTLITQNDRQFMLNSFQPGGSIQGQASSLPLENLSCISLSSACLDPALFCPARMSNPSPSFEISPTIGTMNSVVPSVASSSVINHHTTNSTTACLDEGSLVCPVRLNPNPSFEIPSVLEDSCSVSSVPLNSIKHPQTNYIGYSLSNINKYTELGQFKGGQIQSRETLDLPGDADQFLINRKTVPPSYEGINGDMGASSASFVPDHRREELLSDVVQDYQMLISACPVRGHQGNSNESQSVFNHSHNQSDYQPFTPFDLSEFDILSDQQTPIEASGNCLHISFTDQVNQNQPQINEPCENIASSNFYSGGACPWDNLIPSSSQAPNQQQCSQGLVNNFQAFNPSMLIDKTVFAPPLLQANKAADNPMEFGSFSHQTNKTLVMNPPAELRDHDDDDEFLDSLFAPFGEDQTLMASELLKDF